MFENFCVYTVLAVLCLQCHDFVVIVHNVRRSEFLVLYVIYRSMRVIMFASETPT